MDIPEPAPPSSPISPASLTEFFTRNPESTCVEEEGAYIIRKPWADDTIAVRVPKEAKSVLDALNSVRLPPRFTAIWHTDTGDLEFIYGPLPKDDQIRSRSFSFAFRGGSYKCEYRDASDRLALIGGAARPIGPSSGTEHRNISAIRTFSRLSRVASEAGKPLDFELTSFWVRAVGLPETDVPELARHLNFYMLYYDRESPRILVHEEPITRQRLERPVRYPRGPFPSNLSGRPLDPYLLTLWESAVTAPDPMRRFLYNYQILEYAAFYYLREEMSGAIRRILGAPDLTDRVTEASRQILDVIVDDRANEDAKIASVFQQSVDPANVWCEIEPKAAFFAAATEFDGGCSLPALIKPGWTLEDFKASWLPKLPDALRKLRNALVHAREQRQSKCIAPTTNNQHLLRPWAAVAAAISNELIVYGSL